MLLWAACADTEQYVAPDNPEPPVMPSFHEVAEQWEKQLPSISFKDVTEVIPTNAEDPDYDNFIENQDFKASRYITLTWKDDKVEVENTQVEKGVEITVKGAHVVVTNLESEEGADDARGKVTYVLQGKSDDGQLKIYSNKKFQLLLNDLQLACMNGPAISIQQKKRCFVTLAENTLNYLQDGEVYASDALDPDDPNREDEKGALFSEGQLIFGGKGGLTVAGRHQHGIASDEYVRIHPGCNIVVNALKDGIHTKQQYHQSGSLVISYCAKDAIQADSLGITVTGGYLYLFGERPMTANGGGSITVTEPGKVAQISWEGDKSEE